MPTKLETPSNPSSEEDYGYDKLRITPKSNQLGHHALDATLLVDVLGTPLTELDIPQDALLALTGTKASTVGPHEEQEG